MNLLLTVPEAMSKGRLTPISSWLTDAYLLAMSLHGVLGESRQGGK